MDKSGGKKGSKTAAWKAWCKVPSGEYEKIEASIKGYRAELEDKAWMPSCALSTYLNQQRWDQYVGEQTTRKDAMRELWDGLIEDQRLNPDKVTKGDFARGVDKCMDAGWSTQQIYTAWENYLYINQNNAFQQGIIRFLAPENIEQFTKMSDERVEALRKEQDQSSKERR